VIRVQAVAPDSLGAALELPPGTELLAVNGRPLEDFLDWEFLTADEQFVLQARLPSGEEIEYDVERPEGLPMGVMLEPPRIRRCANHCDFCFALVPLRQFRDPDQPEAVGPRAHRRIPSLAALRLRARHRLGGAPLAAAQS